MSRDRYNDIMRATHNAGYLDMIDRSMEQIKQGDELIRSTDWFIPLMKAETFSFCR